MCPTQSRHKRPRYKGIIMGLVYQPDRPEQWNKRCIIALITVIFMPVATLVAFKLTLCRTDRYVWFIALNQTKPQWTFIHLHLIKQGGGQFWMFSRLSGCEERSDGESARERWTVRKSKERGLLCLRRVLDVWVGRWWNLNKRWWR